MTLDVELGDQDTATKSLAAQKSELAKEKAAQEKAQVEAKTLARAVDDLWKMTNRFTTQVPALEEKVKHMDNKVLDGLTELRTKELDLE
jgi:hypothetical protein